MPNISLYGFNNLSKSLSFSLYKVHYLTDGFDSEQYQQYIQDNYHAAKLTNFLTDISNAIGGNILNVAKQDYQPHGASVTLMIAEDAEPQPLPNDTVRLASKSIVTHLDKSHLCIHTYPEEHPQSGISIFRADIELTTCGIISPLKVINFVLEAFDADIADIDYRVRGMTRSQQGKKLYIDTEVGCLSHHISGALQQKYEGQYACFNANNIFHAKLKRRNILLDGFIVNDKSVDNEAVSEITAKLSDELQQIFDSSE